MIYNSESKCGFSTGISGKHRDRLALAVVACVVGGRADTNLELCLGDGTPSQGLEPSVAAYL